MEILFCTGEKKGGWEGSRMATDGDGVDIMSSESEDSGMESFKHAGRKHRSIVRKN